MSDPGSVAAESGRIDERMVAALHRVTDAALAYLPEEALLQELLQRVAEVMSIDTVAILLLEGDELHARAARGIEEEVEQGVRIPLGRGFAGRVAAERRSIALRDVDTADIHNPILRQKGLRSLLGVPLLVEGEVIGVLHVGSLSPRDFTAGDGMVLQLVADRAALAIQHGRILRREREARETAERAMGRLEAVGRVTDASLAYLPEEALLRELLNRVAEIMSIDTVAILLLEGDALHARAARGIEEEVEQAVRVPLGRGFAGRIAAERRPIAISDVDDADVLNPILVDKGIRSLLGVPLLVEGEPIGVLHVGSLTPREFTAEDATLLQLVADRAALAIEQARLYEQRSVAEALQRRLLPTVRTARPNLETAGRYLPAAGTGLGGDWYDVFALPGGRIGLAVGDVVGHGVEAAAIMSQLRTALRAYAIEGRSPAVVVDRVGYLMATLGPDALTTLAYLSLDPAEGEFEIVVAGHPPPLVIGTDGEAAYLPVKPGPPLGAATATVRTAERHPFPAGAVVLLYTDGLVERRSEGIDAGLERLRALAAGHRTVDELCAVIVERLVAEAPADDIAFLAATVPILGDELETRWPARPDSLAEVRHLLRRWLADRGAAQDEVDDVIVATQEACANAVEHAYGPGAAEFEVHARRTGRRVAITVRDAGQWRAPRGANRGRGLPIMEALMEEVEIQRGDHGTDVELVRTLRDDA